MKPKIVFSCDDGLAEQFKWSKLFSNAGIECTFYVNPFSIGNPGFLSLSNLRKLQEDGHIIGNHMWMHEAPASFSNDCNVVEEIIMANFRAGRDWLLKNGFEAGSKLLALPYGTVGGKWSDELKQKLGKEVHVRDYGSNMLNRIELCSSFMTGRETDQFLIVDDMVSCYCFHGNRTMKDSALTMLVEKIEEALQRGEVELSSIRSLANAG